MKGLRSSVCERSNENKSPDSEQYRHPPSTGRRVILSMGGKRREWAKTSVITGLAEWFRENQIPVKLLDLDTENKARGSLTHFFRGDAPKVNIHTPAGLDAFVDELTDGPPVILADMGAGAGQVTYDWFDKMYTDVSEAGIVFTAIGIVTSDPASVESVLAWASRLQRRTVYLIVENSDFRAHRLYLLARERAGAAVSADLLAGRDSDGLGCRSSKTPHGITE